MYPRFVLLIFCLAVGVILGEVKLTKNRKETVTFKGEELIIDIDNTLGAIDDLTLCFGSSPEESRQPCPLGFARFTQAIGDNEKVRFIVNRQGQFVDGLYLKTRGKIRFNDDGTLNIMVAQLPDARTTVTLPNADVFVTTKRVDGIVKKKRFSVGATGIVAIVIILMVVGVIVGIVVWCCITSTSKPNQTAECNDQDDSLPSQQFRHRKMSTPQKPSSKKQVNRTSNTATTTVRTTVSPKQSTQPCFGINNKSLMES